MNLSEGLLLLEARETLYHGTTSDHVRQILKQGLHPNPKHKVWKKQGVGGIYLTPRIDLAMEYAYSAVVYLGGSRAIVQAQVESRTASPGQAHGSKQLDAHRHLGNINWDAGYDKAVKRTRKWLRKNIQDTFPNLHRTTLTKLLRLGDEWMDVYQDEDNAPGYNTKPTAAVHRVRAKFFDAMTGLIDKMAPSVDPVSRRLNTPITFRGSNKIEAVVVIDDDRETIFTMYGGAKASKLAMKVDDIISNSGKEYTVVRGSLKDL